MADLEDALKKLDRLTQEEARMALVEVLRITNNVCDEVRIVDGKIERVENKIEDMGDKVRVVIDGARDLSASCQTILTPVLADGKQAREAAQETSLVIQHTANDIDEIKCPWLLEHRHCLQLMLNLTRRESVYTTPAILALSC